jgi:DNA-binding NtrC family response regulator
VLFILPPYIYAETHLLLPEVFIELRQEFIYKLTRKQLTNSQESDVNSTELHILIAEDELSHAVIIRRRLEKEYPNARIEVVTSIHDYRNSIVAATPSIVLMDLNLTDGCTLDLLKASSVALPFPVVMMSSYASEQVAADAVTAGAVDFIIKSPEVFLSIADIIEKTVREWEQRLEKNEAR